MSAPPTNIDEVYIIYNTLPPVELAYQNFLQKLKDAGRTLNTFLRALAPLFSQGENAGRYSVWLLHGHFNLNPGEVMVEIGDTMAPMRITDTLLQIEGGRWNSAGFALEHRSRMHDPHLPPPPPSEFMDKFRRIAAVHNVEDLVGVAYARMPTNGPDYVYLETTDDQNRTHVSTQVLVGSLDGTQLSTAWTPALPGMSVIPEMPVSPGTPVLRVTPFSTSTALCALASHVCIGHTEVTDQLTTTSTAAPAVTPRN